MSESENILRTIKTAVRDMVAADVRELKVRMSALEGRMSSLEDRMKVQFESFRSQSDAQFKAVMAAIGQIKAESEVNHL